MRNNPRGILLCLVVVILCCACNSGVTGNSRKGGTETYSANPSPTERSGTKSSAPEVAVPELTVKGEYLKAFALAYSAFGKESQIPLSKRRIENYDIVFHEDKDSYTIVFDPRMAAGEESVVGGETSLGVEVSYAIRKRDFILTERLFYK